VIRAAAVFALILMSGCGTYHTLEELEAQALATGDWSAVEQRERMIARQSVRNGIACPGGRIGYCEDTHCTCMTSDDMRELLDTWR